MLLVVVSGLAWILAGAALRPVERMRQETSAISEGDLEKRLQVPATGDEIARLATTLNDMLARLEQAFERERRFVDDASHELRTPLGILRTELELALRRSRTREEMRAALVSAAEEAERLSRLAEDLLVLARSDRGRLPLHRTRVEASAIVLKTIDFFRRRASERGVAIDVSVPPGLEVDVDELRIDQALGNLIDNALAHTPEGGSIRVSVAVNAARELVFSVADTGGGFPETFIDRAFDPFTRADSGRSRRQGGAGLGLAIVRGVTEAHGGSVEAANRPEGGAVVTLRIPAWGPPISSPASRDLGLQASPLIIFSCCGRHYRGAEGDKPSRTGKPPCPNQAPAFRNSIPTISTTWTRSTIPICRSRKGRYGPTRARKCSTSS